MVERRRRPRVSGGTWGEGKVGVEGWVGEGGEDREVGTEEMGEGGARLAGRDGGWGCCVGG